MEKLLERALPGAGGRESPPPGGGSKSDSRPEDAAGQAGEELALPGVPLLIDPFSKEGASYFTPPGAHRYQFADGARDSVFRLLDYSAHPALLKIAEQRPDGRYLLEAQRAEFEAFAALAFYCEPIAIHLDAILDTPGLSAERLRDEITLVQNSVVPLVRYVVARAGALEKKALAYKNAELLQEAYLEQLDVDEAARRVVPAASQAVEASRRRRDAALTAALLKDFSKTRAQERLAHAAVDYPPGGGGGYSSRSAGSGGAARSGGRGQRPRGRGSAAATSTAP